MQNSALISLLKTFPEKEIQEFDKFLRSPYFTEGKNIRHKIIYEYFKDLRKFYPGFSDSRFTKEYFFSKLYPDTKYNDGIMRKLNSDLTGLAEKFLSQREFENDKFKMMEYLIYSLSPRKLDKFFLKKANECYKFLEGDRLNLYYHFNKQLADILVNNFCIYRQELLSRYDLQKEADNFFLYFISRALEIYRNMTIDQGQLNLKYTPSFMDEVINFVKKNPEVLEKNPLIDIHYHELMVNISSDDSNFTRLKSLKNKFADELDIFGKYNIYINLQSFCVLMIRNGQASYRKELLELDKEILEKNLYGFTDYISYSVFLAAVRNAARAKEFFWAEKFMTAYRNKLDPRHKDFAVNFAMAEILSAGKNYNKALEYLSRINIEFSAEKFQVKALMLKIYYETGSYENAYSLIDSSRHFLRNDKQLPESRKKSFLTFLSFCSQLINIKLNPDEKKSVTLKKSIHRSRFFSGRDWLMEKIEELQK